MTVHHPLPDSHYTIVSQASDYFVRRKPFETLTLLPKGVFTLDRTPKGDEHVRYDWNFLWQLEQIHNGLYKLKVKGAPVGNRGGHLYAFLSEHDQHSISEWRLVPVPQVGKDAYLIELHDQSIGWVASAEKAPKDKEIEVKRIIVEPSQPPKYPPTEVFIIKPAKHEGEQ
ncbi:hypothetical protein NM688_g7869 [Phlebia brevispora]|uniref:Uncharacterized protein n=1 Tax=Phlebia brevispora TaxID=194682 RepID=A0ACC1S082_9APHY|nr:hypothetical protein NM688_g7869 [Phlebia brevispora]